MLDNWDEVVNIFNCICERSYYDHQMGKEIKMLPKDLPTDTITTENYKIIKDRLDSLEKITRSNTKFIKEKVGDGTVKSMPPKNRSLMRINADKRKIQNRINTIEASLSVGKGEFLILLGVVTSLCSIAGFIFLPWVVGLSIFGVGLVSCCGGGILAKNPVGNPKELASLQDKLIDLEVEESEAIEADISDFKLKEIEK